MRFDTLNLLLAEISAYPSEVSRVVQGAMDGIGKNINHNRRPLYDEFKEFQTFYPNVISLESVIENKAVHYLATLKQCRLCYSDDQCYFLITPQILGSG